MFRIVLKTIDLVLPVLFPSWHFFKSVDASPRIEFREVNAEAWHRFSPRPGHLSVRQIIRRLFLNAEWNDTLFAMSCAERIEDGVFEHSVGEIEQRIFNAHHATHSSETAMSLQFRLVFVQDRDGTRSEDVVFVSAPFTQTAAGAK
jgi:hypothetical protein